MNVKLVKLTPDAEAFMIWVARVSNPSNQDNEDYAGLLRRCVRERHWSVFEHAHATFEVETSLAVAAQILRHRSFCFQQFSMRYANPLAAGLGFEPIELRKQAVKNRQSSLEPIGGVKGWLLSKLIGGFQIGIQMLYELLIFSGVAREVARFVLPASTTTRMYVTGNIRSFIHYIDLRTKDDVQAEHRGIALLMRESLSLEMPTLAASLGWLEGQAPLPHAAQPPYPPPPLESLKGPRDD
jgi:thymidylate synthase (FAD)